MNIKGNIKYISIGSIVFLLIYMFVAAIPMESDIYFEPVWTADISAPVEEPADFSKTGIEAFVLGDRFGYFTPDGGILSSKPVAARVSASPAAWAAYAENAADTPVYSPDGSLRMTVPGSGFVHLDQERTYLFLPGGDGVSQFDTDGSKIWTREHTAPLTAFNSSEAGTILGYGDGLLTLVRKDGSVAFSFYPGGSDLEVILGAAVSGDGTLAACVSGIDPQRFLLVRINGDQYKVVHHENLAGNLRRQSFVDFEQNGDYAFFESENALGIIDCKKLESSSLPLEGQTIATGEYPGNALFLILSKNDNLYTLSAVERPDHLVASANFIAENAFLVQREKTLYLGTDDAISRIDIRGIK